MLKNHKLTNREGPGTGGGIREERVSGIESTNSLSYPATGRVAINA